MLYSKVTIGSNSIDPKSQMKGYWMFYHEEMKNVRI